MCQEGRENACTLQDLYYLPQLLPTLNCKDLVTSDVFWSASQSWWSTSTNLIRFHLPVTSLEQRKRIVHLWLHPGLTPRVGVLERKDRSWGKTSPYLFLSADPGRDCPTPKTMTGTQLLQSGWQDWAVLGNGLWSPAKRGADHPYVGLWVCEQVQLF